MPRCTTNPRRVAKMVVVVHAVARFTVEEVHAYCRAHNLDYRYQAKVFTHLRDQLEAVGRVGVHQMIVDHSPRLR